MTLYVGANTEKEDKSGNQSDSYAERFPDVISVATYQSGNYILISQSVGCCRV